MTQHKSLRVGLLFTICLGLVIGGCSSSTEPAKAPHATLYNEPSSAELEQTRQQAELSIALLSSARVNVSTIMAHALRMGATLWVETHERCPTTSEILDANLVSSDLGGEDAWDNPFRINCLMGQTPSVRSAGPDGVYGNGDDIIAGE